jgi:hypothetical protein
LHFAAATAAAAGGGWFAISARLLLLLLLVPAGPSVLWLLQDNKLVSIDEGQPPVPVAEPTR